jgi:hypothetical protein
LAIAVFLISLETHLEIDFYISHPSNTMKKLGLASLLLLLVLFTSCDKIVDAIKNVTGLGGSPVKVNFEGIQSFEESNQHRESLFKKITGSDQSEDSKTENLNALDSLYWGHVSSLLSSGRSAILDSPARASEKLDKVLNLKRDYQKDEYAGIKSPEVEQIISKQLSQLEADIVSLRHEQAWDTRLKKLEEEVKKFGKINFTGQFGETPLSEEVLVIDSLESNELGDVKQIIYTVKYTKIYKGTGKIFKYQVDGQGEWKVSSKMNQSLLTIENLCPQCYSERRIN